jgi:hypothetical protein
MQPHAGQRPETVAENMRYFDMRFGRSSDRTQVARKRSI